MKNVALFDILVSGILSWIIHILVARYAIMTLQVKYKHISHEWVEMIGFITKSNDRDHVVSYYISH